MKWLLLAGGAVAAFVLMQRRGLGMGDESGADGRSASPPAVGAAAANVPKKKKKKRSIFGKIAGAAKSVAKGAGKVIDAQNKMSKAMSDGAQAAKGITGA